LAVVAEEQAMDVRELVGLLGGEWAMVWVGLGEVVGGHGFVVVLGKCKSLRDDRQKSKSKGQYGGPSPYRVRMTAKNEQEQEQEQKKKQKKKQIPTG